MLKGLKILEFQGLAPSVFCGMYFSDQGAQVILVARPQPAAFSMQINKNIMNRNKKCIKLSLKTSEDRQILHSLLKTVDVIIDPYRPGVLQKENIGPQQLYKLNPKVILLRVTGYGQSGEMALRPGHDLNYIASSGILNLMNGQRDALQFPANYVADFLSASLGISGTLLALINRRKSQEGCVVDCSLTGGCSYLTNLISKDKNLEILKDKDRIKYFQWKDKRYVMTQNGNSQQVSYQACYELIEKMNKQDLSFFKDRNFQIAQIKTIQRIKAQVLPNPFKPPELESMENIIPKRDQNREQILFKYINPRPKL